jgi:hypothetical protein
LQEFTFSVRSADGRENASTQAVFERPEEDHD